MQPHHSCQSFKMKFGRLLLLYDTFYQNNNVIRTQNTLYKTADYYYYLRTGSFQMRYWMFPLYLHQDFKIQNGALLLLDIWFQALNFVLH